MSENRKLPTGRLSRLTQIARVGLRTGASLLLDQGTDATAKRTAEILGTMRGLAAKVGQMASYVDGVVPEAHRDTYESAMATLRSQAPTSSFEDVRRILEAELGKPLEDLFASFDEAPIASASIGQVHRATLQDGKEVAVKVQHHGISEAMESDLSNGSLLEGLVGTLAGKRVDSKGLYEVVKARFREELDYELEAQRIAFFRDFHANDRKVFIPAVIGARSTKRVLTTEFVRGLSFDEARLEPESKRQAWAETLWKFVFRGNLEGGLFNADPHPGNFFFQEDGRVAFIDFGCCQAIPDFNLTAARRIHLAALSNDDSAFRKGVAHMLQSKPGPLEDMAVAYTRRCFEPVFASPYRITKDYVATLVSTFKDMAIYQRTVPDSAYFTMPRDMLFINRLQFGFYSVLARLDASVDYAEVERSFVPDLALD